MAKFILEINLGNDTASVPGIRERYTEIRRSIKIMTEKVNNGKLNFVNLRVWGRQGLIDRDGNIVGHYEVVDS